VARKLTAVLGGLLALIGIVWILQGVGVLGGSFMTGDPLWAWIGAGVLVAGDVLLFWSLRRGR